MEDLVRDRANGGIADFEEIFAEFLARQGKLEKRLRKLHKKLASEGKDGGKKHQSPMQGLGDFGAKVLGSLGSELLARKFKF